MSRKPISTKIRYQVFARDNFTCRYCGAKPPDVILHLDHDTPVSKGGDDSEENLKTACSSCNQGKGDLMPKTERVLEAKSCEESGKHPLVGWSFLSYTVKENGKPEVEFQAVIRAVVKTTDAIGECALVDFMDWIMGEYSYSQLIPLTKFTQPFGSPQFFKLFPNLADQKDYYRRWHGKSSDEDDDSFG